MKPERLELQFLHNFVKNRVIPGVSKRDKSYETPLELYRELHELGWWNCFLPVALGGSAFSTVELCSVVKAISYGSPGIATSFAANMAALLAIQCFGSNELKTLVFSNSNQFSFASFCFTEADSGSDVLSIKSSATPTSGGYILTGSKCFITNANYSDHLVVIAKIKNIESPKKSMSVFYVPAKSKGVSLGKPLRKLGQRDSNTSEVHFENVFVPDSHLIGKHGDALLVGGQSLQRSRTILAASALGLCDRASHLLKDFLTNRIHYSKPLLEQPTIRSLLARLHTKAEAAWQLTLSAASAWDNGDTRMLPSSMAKLFAAEVAVEFSQSAMELFGGWGYTEEYEIERLYRDAKLYETLEGPSFVQHSIIAKELFSKEDASANRSLKAA